MTTKDTKEIIIRTLLNIASESQKVTIEEISKQSLTLPVQQLKIILNQACPVLSNISI